MELEELYDRIYRYCYFHTGRKELAEDLTQETFLRFFHRNTSLHPEKQLAYLYTIAKNLCTDAYWKKREELPGEDLESRIKEHVLPLEQAELRLDLKQAILQMDRQTQELLLLRYVDGLSPGEAGKVLELSRFAVYRREKEALRKLRDYFSHGNEV
ncbi:RNA polymerase sigma factor [Blautia sp.]|uniref:RNA polymerase sigma factor n=1 Tax=Blautia sp. TaxID=1955243 RepID=UPI002E7AAC5D|nr:sigma-70 family RNA polymerase sigma factor [Blautia sp.]MEE0809807.1 sigma-70 family RNA polymerase sigma factor [Blautia sp.]